MMRDKADIDLDAEAFAEYTRRRMQELVKSTASVKTVERESALVEKTKRDTMVVHFGSPSFARCKEMNRALDAICSKFPSIEFVTVDAKKFPLMCERLGVQALPFLGFFTKGFFIGGVVGFEQIGDTRLSLPLLERKIKESDLIEKKAAHREEPEW